MIRKILRLKWTAFPILLLLLILSLQSCTYQEPLSIKREKGVITGQVYPIGLAVGVAAYQGSVQIDSTVSDSLGYYRFADLKHGVYSLRFEAQKYGSVVVNDVTVYEGGTTAVHEVYLKNYPEQVLDSQPINSQTNYPLDGSISIYFTEPMNKPSVEAALTISPKLKGRFLWNNDATEMQFIPNPQLESNKTYQVILSTQAKTKFNIRLSFEYSFKFTTAPLQLVSSSPFDGATLVSNSTSIRFLFNSILNLTTIDQAIVFNPEILGNFTSLDGMTLVFTPGNYLQPETQYQITIDTSLTDIYGVKINPAEIFYFETEPVQLTSYYPGNGATNISKNTSISLTFNAEMNQASVVSGFSITPGVTGTFQWDSYNSVRFTPYSPFEANTQYKVQIKTTCSATNGKKLPKLSQFVFTTEAF